MKAVVLARVSTKEQEEGHSIAAQRQRLIDYGARKGLDVIQTFELVESSTRGERKEFTAMLDFAKRGARPSRSWPTPSIASSAALKNQC